MPSQKIASAAASAFATSRSFSRSCNAAAWPRPPANLALLNLPSRKSLPAWSKHSAFASSTAAPGESSRRSMVAHCSTVESQHSTNSNNALATSSSLLIRPRVKCGSVVPIRLRVGFWRPSLRNFVAAILASSSALIPCRGLRWSCRSYMHGNWMSW